MIFTVGLTLSDRISEKTTLEINKDQNVKKALEILKSSFVNLFFFSLNLTIFSSFSHLLIFQTLLYLSLVEFILFIQMENGYLKMTN